jgi:hypothetical protein
MDNYFPKYEHIQTWMEIIERNGKLALTWGWHLDNEHPREYRDIKLTNIKSEGLDHVIGSHITEFVGNRGRLPTPFDGYGWIDSTGMEEIREYRPVPKPRGRRAYGQKCDWEWKPNWCSSSSGRWVRTFIYEEN